MNSFVKKAFLIISFAVIASAFALFFPEASLAQTVNYRTDCGEQFSIGSGSNVYCSVCHSEYSSWPCCPCCTQYSCSGTWKEYKTDTAGCNPTIMIREVRSVCGSGSACCSCGPCQPQYGPWEVCEDCGNWQKAERSCEVIRAGLEQPEAKCSGDCIDAPINPRYYDNPDYPTNQCQPEESEDPNNVYLPVKLDWDDTKGWKDGWREGDTCPKTCSESCPDCPGATECYEEPECVHSYVIKITQKAVVIEEETIEEKEVLIDGEVLDKSEYNILEEKGSCFLKPNRTYEWQVRGCCDAEGESCGAWSGPWEFTTNAAPEPKLPYDPDWHGLEKAENLSQEQSEKLQWCEMEDQTRYEETTVFGEKYYRPLSYNILIYYSDEDLCHPQLSFGGQCIPKLLSPDEAKREKLPPDELDDSYSTFFTKKTPYAWQVSACKDAYGFDCTSYSQLWKFETGDWALSVTPTNPPDDSQTPIGLPVLLKWSSRGANSFNYEIIGIESGTTDIANIALDYPKLNLNTTYQWRVQPCESYDPKDCEEDSWFGPWTFKTTGQPPQLTSPVGNDILIPVNFEWEAVPGAKSYRIKVQGITPDEGIPVEEPKFSLDYPDLKQETNYAWQVKTCAREGGNVCGEYSSSQSFKTFKLSEPAGLIPEDNGEIYTYQSFYNISWQPVQGARFYQYEVTFASAGAEDPKKEECQSSVGERIVTSPDNIISRSSASLPLTCWGDYQWQVKACMDILCQENGDYSTLRTFSFVAKEAPIETQGLGLVPCGREADDPSTKLWDETEKCQIKHLFVMLFSLIDFFLWKVIPIILVLLAIASGVIFYFSMQIQSPDPVAKVKSLWRAAGIALAIIFFSWIIISLFLNIFGYRVGAFGPWWQIF
ncbi:MAG: hypothetical protein Q8P08_01390 [bacterium]|nr:hypothetical protein [bacterium]